MMIASDSPIEKAVPVVVTAAQPTAQLHLGNYLGAMRSWISLIKEADCFMFICDLHAITVKQVPADLRQFSLKSAALYLACGLNPEKCTLFLQSQVRGHTELAWILACLCPLGELQRMTQFKDKAQRGQDGFVGSGLLYYPALMAADILLYGADKVPVGEDQTQHLELTRELANRFNTQYSPTFSLPEGVIPDVAARVMSLQDPSSKMSKSDPNTRASVFLLDQPSLIRKKIASAVTDSGSEIKASEDKPGMRNLLEIYSALSGQPISDIEAAYSDARGYAGFKEALGDLIVHTLSPIQDRYHELMQDKDALLHVLHQGAQKAQRRADRTLSKVYRKTGFLQ